MGSGTDRSGSEIGPAPPGNTWALAVDFGTSFSTAAVVDLSGIQVVEVDGERRVPSGVMLDDDGAVLVGSSAAHQGAIFPDRFERTPKAYLGRRVLVLGGVSVTVTAAVGAVLSAFVTEAGRLRGGGEPSVVVLTYPARWSSERIGALCEAAAVAGIVDPVLVTEPVAAASHYLDGGFEGVQRLAVFDLGGGTFDTAVLQRSEDGALQLLGEPGGDPSIGGELFDHQLFELVSRQLAERAPEVWSQLGRSDERRWQRAARDLRVQLRLAKELLSTQTRVTVYVPEADIDVAVTRSELEGLIRDDIERAVDELEATIGRAGLTADQLDVIYLAGGSSRIPLVGQLLSERFGGKVTTWDDPKMVVAMGAGRAAEVVTAELPQQEPGATAVTEPLLDDDAPDPGGVDGSQAAGVAEVADLAEVPVIPEVPVPDAPEAAEAPVVPAVAPESSVPTEPLRPSPPPGPPIGSPPAGAAPLHDRASPDATGRRRWPWLVVAAALLVVALAAAALVVNRESPEQAASVGPAGDEQGDGEEDELPERAAWRIGDPVDVPNGALGVLDGDVLVSDLDSGETLRVHSDTGEVSPFAPLGSHTVQTNQRDARSDGAVVWLDVDGPSSETRVVVALDEDGSEVARYEFAEITIDLAVTPSGTVWVKGDTLWRIDSDSTEPEVVIQDDNEFGLLSASDEDLYLVLTGGCEVLVLDDQLGWETFAKFTGDDGCSGVLADSDRVWICADSALVRLDPSSGERLEEIPTDGLCEPQAGPDGGPLVVDRDPTLTVQWLNPETGDLDPIPLGAGASDSTGVVSDGTRVWVMTDSGLVPVERN